VGDHFPDAGGDDVEIEVIQLPDAGGPGVREFQDHQPSAGLQDPQHFFQAFFQVLKIPDAKGYGDGVEAVVGLLDILAVAFLQDDLFQELQPGDLLAAYLQHACGNIDAGDLFGGKVPGHEDGHVGCSCSYVEDLAGLQGGKFADGASPPVDVDPAGEEAIEEVIAESDPVEHSGYLLLFSQLRVLEGDDLIVRVLCHKAAKLRNLPAQRIFMIIRTATYVISSPDHTKSPAPDRPEYAFIGRSNVGKSSLINMLTGNEKLAKTSGTPGKTQLINHFNINDEWYIVDLPGYGFAKVAQSDRRRWEQMIENYLRKRENLETVFVLIDARHSPQKLDLEFLDRLRKWNIPFCLVFTKSDKENQRVVSKNVKDFLEKMRATWQFLPQHFVTSAVKKMGRDKILGLIEEMNGEFNAE